jgi:hypothetical protein
MARVLVVPWSMAMMWPAPLLKAFLPRRIVAEAGGFVSREIAFRGLWQGAI